MKRFSLLIPLLIAGCVTTELQYKEGVTPAQRNRDVAACERAAGKIPTDKRISITPRVWVPSRQHCNKHGCSYHGGYWSGGHVNTVDANLPAKKRTYAQCMSRKGYQSLAVTGCTGKMREAVMRSPQGRYPRLSANSCTVGMADGTLKVHTP